MNIKMRTWRAAHHLVINNNLNPGIRFQILSPPLATTGKKKTNKITLVNDRDQKINGNCHKSVFIAHLNIYNVKMRHVTLFITYSRVNIVGATKLCVLR
jgi:hypothetical protein